MADLVTADLSWCPGRWGCEWPACHVSLAGVSLKTAAVNSREGDEVTLLCHNVVYPDCSSTTWIYHPLHSKTSIELIDRGKIKDSHRNGKLRLQADCSLHINNVSTGDAGLYACQQFITMFKHGDDAKVYLSVLTSKFAFSLRNLATVLYLYTSSTQQLYIHSGI